MEYDKKALGALDKIVDAIFYEEGRLMIINKYGTFLSEDEKVQATQLITKQRANLDRLFTVYKNDLDPLMADICKTGEEMTPLVAKLISSEMVVNQVESQHEVVANKSEIPVIVDSTQQAVNVDTPIPVEENATISNSSTAIESAADVGNNLEAKAANAGETNVTSENSVVVTPPAETVGGDRLTETSPVVAEIENTGLQTESVQTGGENVVASVNEEEVPSNFVLSPIDEDVSPVPTVEEKTAEAAVTAADQQLQAIDSMRTEIENNPALSAEEKKVELTKYARMTDGVVKAILVTKAQFEKLLASRKTQKELLDGKQVDGTSEVVPAISDFAVAGETPIVVDAPVEDTSATAAVAAEITGDAVLSMIDGSTTGESNQTAVEQAANTTSEVVLPTIEVSSTALTPTSVTNGTDTQSELQTMIEQANLLYKEGKVAEAQELFNKVEIINKGMQTGGDATGGEAKDVSVLVKK